MEKKIYIAPAVETWNVESEMIATSGVMGIYDDDVNTSEEGTQLGNGRRGHWGDLWNE